MQDTSSLPAPLAEGTLLAHYRIVSLLGEGAMGRVYSARDLGLDRPVALKVLNPHAVENRERVRRFAMESRAAARVTHKNLTHIYYVGSHEKLRFFAMELIPGDDLADLIAREGPLPLGEAIDVLVQIAEGMAAAHRAGVVHRDLKPSNLIRRPDGTIKITDFGLSKSQDVDVGGTHAGQILGTPMFMSPEQCRGLAVDARTDIYALGLIAWTLLAGRQPFPGPALGQVMHDQINTSLPSLAALDAELPAALDTLLAELTAKDPARRPATMEEVVDALETLRPRPIDAAPISARGAAAFVDGMLALVLTGATAWLAQRILGMPKGSPFVDVFFAIWHLAVVLVPEWLAGRTAGKWLLEIGVTREDGLRADPKQHLLRYGLRYGAILPGAIYACAHGTMLTVVETLASFTLIGIGLGVYAWTKRFTWSDLVTRTRVVHQLPVSERRRQRRARLRAATSLVRPDAKTRINVGPEDREATD